jgi:hypothetical protein
MSFEACEPIFGVKAPECMFTVLALATCTSVSGAPFSSPPSYVFIMTD